MTNKIFKRASIAATAAALAFGAAAANANTLTFQGITFTTTAVDANTMTLQIDNALNATGDWAGIDFLGAFALKQEGGDVDTGSITNLGGWTFSQKELSAGGCDNGNNKNACFTFSPLLALSNSMTFTMDLGGSSLDTAGIWHLKIQFYCSEQSVNSKCGSLLSQDIYTASTSSGSSGTSGDVPEPGPMSLTLLGLGLLGAGFMRRAKHSA